MFKLKHPESAKNFVKEVKITKVKDELQNKKLLIKEYPEIYNEFNMDLTPRLTIK